MKKFTKSLGLVSTIALGLTLTHCGSNKDDNTEAAGGQAEDQVESPTTSPEAAATSVAKNRKITATFSEAMDPASVTSETFILTASDGTAIAGTVSHIITSDSSIFRFTPASPLSASTVYTAKLTTGIKNLAGGALASDFSWSFTTGTSDDATAPLINSSYPEATSANIPINRELSVVFNEEMDPTTITSESYTVKAPDGSKVTGTISYVDNIATFTPTSPLAPNTIYTVTMTTAVLDLAGNPLATSLIWTFTTGASAAIGPSPVVLGTAGSYVILAKSAISTTGTTSIVGNLGLSPAAQSFMTGFSESLDATNVFATSILVTGQMFAADMAVPSPSNLTTAISDMEIAYTDAAGRKNPDFVELGAGDISGRTLTAGLYKWGTGVLINSDITLAGGENDVWIFQISQDVTVGNGAQITLSGGALAKNIFWQVAGQVTLGTTAVVKGVILSKTQIVLRTGATLNGRALAQTAVTLDANAVTQPAP